MTTWDPDAFPRGEGCVRCTVAGASATILLEQPARKNAISPGMMRDLSQAIKRIEAEPSIASVLLTGSGSAFCAGGDLRAVREHLMTPENGAGMGAWMTAQLDRLARVPVVIIAAVEGVALGGGAELVTVADLVVAAENARIGFVHASLGLSPGWGGGRRLMERVGPRRALHLLAFAARLTGTEALQVGLVDRVVPAGDARANAEALQARLAALPLDAVRAAVRVARGEPEAKLFADLWGSPGHIAALETVRAGR